MLLVFDTKQKLGITSFSIDFQFYLLFFYSVFYELQKH